MFVSRHSLSSHQGHRERFGCGSYRQHGSRVDGLAGFVLVMGGETLLRRYQITGNETLAIEKHGLPTPGSIYA